MPCAAKRDVEKRNMRSNVILLALTALLLGLIAAPAIAGKKTPCERTAMLARRSCALESHADRRVEEGKCLQSADLEAVRECLVEARAAFREERGECFDRYAARREVCDDLEEEIYDPVLDPADFVSTITNPFVPHVPGTRRVYEGMTAEGLERIEVEVLSETRTILGIEATVVQDRVYLDGELIEDTVDWLAQDVDGNVWYLGEVAQNFEDDKLADLDGSWEAGFDGAKPGYWMKGDPAVGDIYRQELLLRDAEDIGEVLSLSESVTVTAGSFSNCLQTKDDTPIEPGVFEHKFYAPGVGMVLEVNPSTGEQIELIEYTLP
jgi:hypothetical protein